MRSAVKQRMKKFRISELSSVDRPAQAHAQALLMKRKDKDYDKEDDEIKKVGFITVVTSADEGHAHMFQMWPGEDQSGETSEAVGVGEDAEEHRHIWALDGEGQIQILMNAGHLHAVARDAVVDAVVAMVRKQELDEASLEKFQKMFPELTATPTQEDIQMDEELKKKADRLESIVALPAAHRAHFDGLEKAEDQDAFLAKSAEERELLVKPSVEKAKQPEQEVVKNENPDAIYTSADGTVFTKSDDPRLVAAMIEKDSKDKEIALLKAEKADAEFEKRAEIELANLPGTVAQRAALLKSIESIENTEHREAALKALKAGNAAGGDVTKSLGTSQGGASEKPAGAQGAQIRKSEAERQLEDLAKAEAIRLNLDPVRDFAKAYNIVVNSAEGRELYNKHRESMISRPLN